MLEKKNIVEVKMYYQNKYKNKKTIIDGIEFDSKAEAKRFCELRLLEKARKIKDLTLQPCFILQPSFKKNGKTYRKIEYIADFQYEENGQVIVEDVKGMKTKEFQIKRKLFEYKYPDLEIKIIK